MSYENQKDKNNSEKLIYSSQEIGSKKWIKPVKSNPNNATKNKIGKTIYFNPILLKKLIEECKGQGNKLSAIVDCLLSEYFGITYEEAYPDSARKSFGEERRWDYQGKYKRMDIEDPNRNSKINRKKKLGILAWRNSDGNKPQ
jgi:hypothetical protein